MTTLRDRLVVYACRAGIVLCNILLMVGGLMCLILPMALIDQCGVSTYPCANPETAEEH